MRKGKVRHSRLMDRLQVGRARATAMAQLDHATLDDRVRAVNRAIQRGLINTAEAKTQLPRSMWKLIQ